MTDGSDGDTDRMSCACAARRMRGGSARSVEAHDAGVAHGELHARIQRPRFITKNPVFKCGSIAARVTAKIVNLEQLIPLMHGKSLVLVDGPIAAGKSTILGPTAAGALSGTHVQVDDYLQNRDGMTFADNVDADRLLAALQSASPPVFLDSICCVEVAERLHLKWDFHVLVLRNDAHTKALLDDAVTEESLIKELYGRLPSGPLTQIRRSVVWYFKRRKPQAYADAIFANE